MDHSFSFGEEAFVFAHLKLLLEDWTRKKITCDMKPEQVLIEVMVAKPVAGLR
jgi:hypothetical protein